MFDRISLQLCSLFYMIILLVVFFSKERIKSVENRIYKWTLIINTVTLLADIFSVFTIIHMNEIPIINLIATKGYLICLATWMMSLTIYISISSFNDEEKAPGKMIPNARKVGIYCITILFIAILVICILPIHYEQQAGIYSYGPSTEFAFLFSGFCIAIWIFRILSRFKYIKKNKCIPIIVYIILGSISAIVQKSSPDILLVSCAQTFATFLIYFTIENPDLKLINELNIAKDQAEKANRAKTEFLSNMSHEIRTPLNAIVGFSQALQEEESIPEKVKAEVKDIVMASDSLLDIVNGILDISKIEANKLEIINTEYNLKKIFDELISLTKARIGDKPLEFRYHMDESIPEVLYGDHIRLKQIILNLLTNSVKYTKEGFVDFKISSLLKGDVCRLIISVEDSGIGIKKEKIDKLFTKFERLGVERSTTVEGTGLGLAITKKLVELMRGQIVVQSVYGKGSKFTVALDQKIIKEKVAIEEKKEEVSYESFDFSSKRVLVVDDNQLNLKVASLVLKKYNVQIDTVLSGSECLEKIRSGEKYDLILLDDMMPRMSGVETFSKLKGIEGFHTPTIALTANAISGMKEKYIKDGFDDYLAKPIDKTELNRVIYTFLAKF